MTEATAIYTIENGTMYVESNVALGGVQTQLTLKERAKTDEPRVAEELDGFETASTWLSDNDYLFLAYSLSGKTMPPGKHALLHIGDIEIASLRLSDTQGKNVKAVSNDVTRISRMGSDVIHVNGIYSLGGQKLSGNVNDLKKLPKGVYIVNGEKILK